MLKKYLDFKEYKRVLQITRKPDKEEAKMIIKATSFGMALIGFCGSIYVVGLKGGLSILKTFPYQYSASYALVVIPLFVLMGEVAFRAGLSWDIYRSTNKIFGGLPGSLGMATVWGCAGFAAISGSSLATAYTYLILINNFCAVVLIVCRKRNGVDRN